MPNHELASENKKDPMKLAVENNPCGVCRSVGVPPPCRGHGGKGGGGSSGGSGTSENSHHNDNTLPTHRDPNTGELTYSTINETKNLSSEWTQLLKSPVNPVQFELGLLTIESDNLRGILTFRAKPGLSKEEAEIVKQVLKMIKAEFDDFKDLLKERGVSTNQFTAVIKDNELTINIPNPKIYAEFIQRLIEKNLLPSAKYANHEMASHDAGKEKKYPTPFDITKGPKPKGWKE